MDETSDDLGSAIIKPNTDVVVNSPNRWEIIYTASKKGIAAGGSVRFEIPYGFSAPQKLFVSEPGYIQAECSNSAVQIEVDIPPSDYEMMPKWRRADSQYYYVTKTGHHIFVKLNKGSLRPGESITLYYGHTLFPNTDALAPRYVREAEFSVAVDPDGSRSGRGSGYYLLPKQPCITVAPAKAAGFEIFARSTSNKPGSSWTAVPVDQFGNCAEITGYIPGKKMKAVNKRRFTVKNNKNKNAVRLHLKDRLTGASFISNPSIKPIDGYNLYWGDIHFHTILSDGLCTPEQSYTFGKNIAKLDFCAISDHDEYLSDRDWETITAATKKYNTPGKFVTLLGYEFSDSALNKYGDQCIYFSGDEGPLLRCCDINRENARDLAEVAEKLKQHNAMIILHNHHPGTMLADPDIVRLAEVYSAWGAAETADGPIPLAKYGVDLSRRCYQHYLQRMKIGAVAGSDGHYGHPGKDNWLKRRYSYWGGLAAVWARKLTRKDIWEALWNRRCYGTTRSRIILWLSINSQPMGSVLPLDAGIAKKRTLHIRAHGTSSIKNIQVIRNNRCIKTCPGKGKDMEIHFTDTRPVSTRSLARPLFYYIKVTQEDGQIAWSSPIWIEKGPSHAAP